MTKHRYLSILTAVIVGMASIPPVTLAEGNFVVAENTLANNATTATESATSTTETYINEWSKNRPDETQLNQQLFQFEGKSVVDVLFDGASDKTLETAKAACSMIAGDKFIANSLEQSRDAIYNTGYFYDLYVTFEELPEGIVVTFHLLENPVLKDIKFIGNTVETTSDLMEILTLKKEEILNTQELHQNIEKLQNKYYEDGYILAKFTDINVDDEGCLILKLSEGVLEGYSVKGNVKTRNNVILREMRQQPGTPFNAKLARRSVQRIQNLGFFESVDVKMNPGVNPDAVVMELNVKEMRTGTFGIGAGYSSSYGIVGTLNVGDKNFLGMGDSIGVTLEISGDDRDARGVTFSYRRPWIDKFESFASLNIYNRTYSYRDYDTDGDLIERYMRYYTGGEVMYGRPISEYSSNSLTLKNRKDEYDKHDGEGINREGSEYKDWREKNFGTTRSFIFQHVTDTRDNVYQPTSGDRFSFSTELAGLGADFDFQKYSLSASRFYPVGHAQVLALRAEIGAANGDVSEFNKFRIGGQNSIRGYRDDQFRGDRMALATVEYRFPVAKSVQAALFTDCGSAWDGGFTPAGSAVYVSAGLGVGINTPVGPLRLDYGWGKNGGRLHFNVGGMF